MSRPARIPEPLRHGPFTRRSALELGLTSRQLQGRHFVRLLPSVWAHRDHVLTEVDHLRAADLATPADARLSHSSRLRLLGLDLAPLRPVHLIVPRDLHLELPGIFLHRTERMPPVDEVGLTPAAALVTWASTATVLELVMAGDWLLHRDLMTLVELHEVAARDLWRPGAREALWTSDLLDGDSASVQESHLRCLLVHAGLPVPEVNVLVDDDPRSPRTDLYYRRFGVAAEFEGGHHFTDTEQIARDIGRYALMRDLGISYEQVTSAMLRHPRAVVRQIHHRLVQRGYAGPEPDFGARWRSLFEPAHLVVPRTSVAWQPPKAG